MRFKKAYLEITNICNLHCSFCPGTDRKQKYLSTEEFSILAEKLRPYTDYLYLHLMGEPLLNPNLKCILKQADNLGYKVIVTTNGTLLADKGTILLESPAVHKINISLQSFEANNGGIIHKYLKSVSGFVQAASSADKICVLRLWNNNGLNSLNDEILKILEMYFPKPWKDLGRGITVSHKVWIENGDKFDWPDLNAQDFGDKCFCYGLRDQIGVLCDGTVVPCCLDHNGDIALGNLFDSELGDILLSERATSIYNGFSGRTAVEELCRKCGYSRRFG